MMHSLVSDNPGDIACRITGTARCLGVRRVAAYSDADAEARHVLGLTFAATLNAPIPERAQFGVFRM